MNRNLYLDNNATTGVYPEVLEAMMPYFYKNYGNPSSAHDYGIMAKRAISDSREYLASLIGASHDEIYFTSGGTESDNWALNIASKYSNPHIVTSKIEHHAILNKCLAMRKEGVKISYLDVDHEANIDLNMLSELLRKQVTMVSVMTANNEIGTVSQYRRIGIMAREYGALYHTDAVCAFGKIPIDVNKDHIDMLSATAHKIHGPKGVGLLYVGKNVKIEPMIYGGGQEGGYRSGTENVPGIVGFAKAAMISFKRMEYRHSVVRKFRDYMVSCILTIKGAYLLGSKSSCLDHTMCFAFEGVYGETLLMLLNERKICVSNGSACHANSDGASHVLMAMGVDKELLYNTIRISIDDNITKYEIDMTVKAIREIVDIIREKERE